MSIMTVASEDIAGSTEFRHLSSIAGIAVDLRYAGPNNFVGRDLYSPFDCAWLHVEAAAALEAAVAWLTDAAPGHTLLVLDALRPQRVQQQLLVLRRERGRDRVQQANDGHCVRPDQARVVNVGKHAHQESVCLLSIL